MKRLGIFLFFDENGVVSDHMKRSLRAFRPHMDDLLFIANGTLDETTMADMQDVVTQTIVRENIGFDVWGYKHGLEHVGYDRLADYDEIVLFNYTFFAPMHDLTDMFDHMAAENVDFWGLTEYVDVEKRFLQSYFLVSRRSLHTSKEFFDYWNDMPIIKSIGDSLDYHEFRFTPTFAKAGYKYKSYVENDAHWTGNTTLTDLPGLHAKGMPVIKYRAFNFEPNYVQRRGGLSPSINFDFVQNETDYPVSEIWDYIISQTPAHTLIKHAGMIEQVAQDAPQSEPPEAVAFAVTLRDPSQVDRALAYLKTVNPSSIWIVSPHDSVVDQLRALGYTANLVNPAEIALHHWAQNMTDTVGNNGLIVNLSDFPGETDRYHFIDHLFDAYWGPFIGPTRSMRAISDWLDQNPHIGLAFVDTDSVDGRQSGHKGLSRHLQGWALKKLPDPLRKAAECTIWPWRGNAVFRANVVLNDTFQTFLSDAVAAHTPRDRDVFAGVEALMPEMVRRAGAASSLIVQPKHIASLLFNARLTADQSSNRIIRLAQDLRKVSHASGKHKAKPAAPDKNSGPGKLNLTFNDYDLTFSLKDDTVGPIKLSRKGKTVREIAPTGFVELAVDEIDVTAARIFIRGWVFDIETPQNYLMLGLAKNGRLISKLKLVQEHRPDVALAFPDKNLLEETGFRTEYSGPELATTDPEPEYHLVFIDTAAQKVATVPVETMLNRGRRYSLKSMFQSKRSLQ